MWDVKGQVNQVRCIICTFVEGKEKLLAPKLNSLLKHQGCHKMKKSMPGVDASQFYFNKDFVHTKNERAYTVVDHSFVLDYLQAEVPFE
jgi:hypothetical protein